jgi:hypothetical protein
MLLKAIAPPTLVVLSLSVSLSLCACGSPHGPAGQAASTHSVRNAAPAAAADSIDADMVAAVSASGSGPPIGVKFRLETRPVVGAPAQLVLALMPTPGLEISHIHASLQTDEGLQLQAPRSFEVDDPQDGAILAQEVTVVPQREGVLSISATVVVDYENTSMARTFIIPLIAAAAS